MRRLLEVALDVVPRMLGLCDRQAASPTAGCCDRNYWHYRLLDVPNARFQEAGLLFALAYTTPHPANSFHGQRRLEEWVRFVWRYWLTRRNGDGSIAEVYPYERSFCATSFSTAAFLESVRLTGGIEAWSDELAAAERTLVWLDRNANPAVSNQMVASWHALAGFAHLTGDERFEKAARRRRDRCLALQTVDGVWPEYGSLDVGYQTVTMSGLASIAGLTPQDEALADSLVRADAAIRDRIGADGSVAVERNSRSTQYIYPHALAHLTSPLFDRLLEGLDNGRVLRPTWMDDRYCHAMAADYLLAYRVSQC